MSNTNLYIIREEDGTFTATMDSSIYDDDRMWRGFVIVLGTNDHDVLSTWMRGGNDD